jgi:predicted transcriptional regulator
MNPAHHDLDRIDLKILQALQEDGRLPNLKLAEAVALSPTAVLARVQRLTRDGRSQEHDAPETFVTTSSCTANRLRAFGHHNRVLF